MLSSDFYMDMHVSESVCMDKHKYEWDKGGVHSHGGSFLKAQRTF